MWGRQRRSGADGKDGICKEEQRGAWRAKQTEAATLGITPHSQIPSAAGCHRRATPGSWGEEAQSRGEPRGTGSQPSRGKSGWFALPEATKRLTRVESGFRSLGIGLLPHSFAVPVSSARWHWGHASQGRSACANLWLRKLPLFPTSQLGRPKSLAKHLSDLKSGVKSLTSHHVLPQCSNLSCSLSPVAHQELPCLPMLVLAVPLVRKDILLHVLLIKTLLILQSLCQMLPPLQSLPWSLQSGGSFFKAPRCGALPSQYFILSAAELLAPIHSHKTAWEQRTCFTFASPVVQILTCRRHSTNTSKAYEEIRIKNPQKPESSRYWQSYHFQSFIWKLWCASQLFGLQGFCAAINVSARCWVALQSHVLSVISRAILVLRARYYTYTKTFLSISHT